METNPLPAEETLVRAVGQHWIKYVFPTFVYVILLSVSVLLFVLAGMAAHHYMWLSHATFIAALILFLLSHHWFFLVILSESMAHIIVTNRRVIYMHDRLMTHEQMVEYSYDKMRIVEADKYGFLQSILQYGSLQFGSGSGIPLVPHPNRIVKDIEQAMGMK